MVLKRGTTILSRETVTDTTKTFTGLTTGLSYSVLVRARDAAGNISVSAFTSFVAKAPADTTAPGAPTGLTGTTTPTTATLAWTASPDADVTAYTVTLTGGGATKTVDVTGTTAEVTGLDPETTYAVSVTARDAAGNTSVPATMSLTTPAAPDTIAPTMPGALTATATSATSATLSWTASTDAKGVTGYRVTLTKGTQPVSTTDVTGTGRTLTGLDPSTAYTVSVTARDAAGNISAAATATFATPALPDTTAPTAPTDLRTTAGTTSVTATWTASTDATGVAGYRVEARVAGTAVATADTGARPHRARPLPAHEDRQAGSRVGRGHQDPQQRVHRTRHPRDLLRIRRGERQPHPRHRLRHRTGHLADHLQHRLEGHRQ